MNARELRGIYVGLLALALAAGCGSSNNTSGGNTNPPPSAQVKLSPIFHGLTSIATAGGASVRLDWNAAVDGETPQNMIRYRVFVSSTPGGQNFASPTVTTAPGVTSVVLTSGNSGLISVGARAYYVVRSLDTDGNSDDNKVELSTVPVLASHVAFVDDTGAGPGTLGDSGDPFTTIQGAVDAVSMAGGGAVLVSATIAGSTYVESVNMTDAMVSSIGIYGGFPRFGAGAGGSATLSARDPAGHPTAISAMGVMLPNGALVYAGNGYRPAFFDGFELRDSTGDAVFGADADLQVSGCTIHDGGDLLLYAPSAATTPSRFRVVGNTMTDSSSNYACYLGGLVSLAYFQNNDIENYDEVIDFSTGTIGAVVLPAGGGTDIAISDNRFISIANDVIYTAFEPDVTANGGALAITVNRNEARNLFSSFAVIEQLGDVGDGGSAHLTMQENLVVGAENEFLYLYLPGTHPTPMNRNLTADIADNTILNLNGDGVISYMEPSQNGTTTLNVQRNLMSNFEYSAVDLNDQDPTATDLGNSAHMAWNYSDNVIPGGAEQSYMSAGVAPTGRTDITATGNTILIPYDQYGLEVNFGYRLGSSSAMPPATGPDGVTGLVLFNNEVHGSDSAAAYLSDERSDNGSLVFGLISNNIMGFTSDPSYNGLELYASDPGDTTWLIQRNFFGYGGQDAEPGLQIYTSGSQMGQIRVLNNVCAFNAGPGIAVDNDGTRPQIINDTLAFDQMYSANGAFDGGTQCYLHNLVISHNGTSDLDPGVLASYSLLQNTSPMTSGYQNVTGDPLYTNSAAILDSPGASIASVIKDIFTLAPQSPAINAGDPDPIYNDPDGSRNDMGAYGGPGAGTMGLVAPGSKIPFVYVGMSPKPDLASGSGLPHDADTLTLILSRPVNATTIAGNVTITSNGMPVAGMFGTAYDGNAITFAPSTTLDANGSSILTITLGTGLKDSDGDSLAYRSSFRVGVVPQDASATPESEPNNDTMTAQALGIGPGRGTAYLACSFSANTDVDVYRFTADAGRRLMTSVGYERINAGNPGSAQLQLLDSTGMVIALAVPTFGGDPYLDYILPAAGTYYLRVMNPGASGGEQYSLQVQTD